MLMSLAVNNLSPSVDYMTLEKKNLSFEIKSFNEEQGVFEGYASIFGNTDCYGDIIEKGAFLESLGCRKPKMLWQHNIQEPIGIYEIVREDERGLYVKGKLAINTQEGKRAYELLKMGALDGLSIGFSVANKGSDYDEENKIRRIKKINLYEISLVTIPANDLSLVSSVKTITVEKEMKSIEQFECMKDFENFLKEPRSLNTEERRIFISKLKEYSKKRDVEEEEAKKRDVEVKKAEVINAISATFDNLLNKFKEN